MLIYLFIVAVGIKLFYAEKEVGSRNTNNLNGVRIAHQRPAAVPQHPDVFGPLEAEQMYYPHSDDGNTQRMLNWIRRGLVIEARENGDIYATRLCQAKVFYGSNVLTIPNELVRSQPTLVFSFQNQFLPVLEAYKKGLNAAPAFERVFSFGQKWSIHEPLKEMLVHCSITHFLSKKIFKEVKAQKPHEIYLSAQDYYDHIIEMKMKKVTLAGS